VDFLDNLVTWDRNHNFPSVKALFRIIRHFFTKAVPRPKTPNDLAYNGFSRNSLFCA
jgi:hypothetical protein